MPSEPKTSCDCGASAVGSPGHSEWCSSLKPKDEMEEIAMDLQKMWEEETESLYAHGLIPIYDDEDDEK